MTAFAYLIEPPFNYRDHDGTVTGCDVELARTVLGMIGFRDVELVEAEFAQLLPGLSNGRWRMTTGLFATDERRQVAAFSQPIWALPDGLLVAKSVSEKVVFAHGHRLTRVAQAAMTMRVSATAVSCS